MDAKSFSFEDAMKRLEEIVRLLENGQVSLDESIKLYEEGIADLFLQVDEDNTVALSLYMKKGFYLSV